MNPSLARLQQPGLRVNRASPLAVGLVGCWVFGQRTGNKVFDLSGYQNHGTLTNGPTRAIDGWAPYIAYDGSNDSVSIPSSASLNLTTAMTAMVWVKFDAAAASCSYFSKGGYYHASSPWAMQYQYDHTHRFTIGNQYVTFAPSGSQLGVLMNVVATYDKAKASDQIACYVNAGRRQSAVGTRTTDIPTSSSAVRFGMDDVYGDTTAHRSYQGMLWNRALTYPEIALLYNDPMALFTIDRRSAPKQSVAAAATTFGFLRSNAGVGNIGGGPFSRSNAGLGVLA